MKKQTFGGSGVARYNEYVIFVKNTIPGDKVKARIFKRKSNYAEARLLELVEPSQLRIDAPCVYFAWCGGCTWQNITYENQLKIKKDHVSESLDHLGQT